VAGRSLSTSTPTGCATPSNAPINKPRCYRAVATRFGRRDYVYRGVYRGTVDVASIGIWLRGPSPDLRDTL
jgi:hypothetical protein